jgi:hypothetical protein
MIPEPGVHFVVKDWGINPYDPPETLKGLDNLSFKELKRLLKALAALPTTPSLLAISGDQQGVLLQIMSLVYFNKSNHFEDDTLSEFVNSYIVPTRVLNWSDDYLVSFMRKQGMFLARIDYK